MKLTTTIDRLSEAAMRQFCRDRDEQAATYLRDCPFCGGDDHLASFCERNPNPLGGGGDKR